MEEIPGRYVRGLRKQDKEPSWAGPARPIGCGDNKVESRGYTSPERHYARSHVGTLEVVMLMSSINWVVSKNNKVFTHFKILLIPRQVKGGKDPIHIQERVDGEIKNLIKDEYIEKLGKFTNDDFIVQQRKMARSKKPSTQSL